MAISHLKVPNGGWKFYQERTKTTVVGSSWNDLVSALTKHRKSNGIDVGDVESDIEKQIEAKQPELIINGNS